jgi:hypothetical protein
MTRMTQHAGIINNSPRCCQLPIKRGAGPVAEFRVRCWPPSLQRQAAAAKKEQAGAGAAVAACLPFKPASPPKRGHYGMLGTSISGQWAGRASLLLPKGMRQAAQRCLAAGGRVAAASMQTLPNAALLLAVPAAPWLPLPGCARRRQGLGGRVCLQAPGAGGT